VSAPRSVLVTGGTGALGRAVVTLLLEQGARVAVSYRRASEWRALQGALAAGDRLVGVEAELADDGAARAAVGQAASALGALEGVALVAGGWAGGKPFDAAPADEWPRMLRANLDSAAHVCRHALPLLRPHKGAIVAVGSRAAETGGAGMAGYAVSKQALHALVRVLALENRGSVRVNAVLPGTIDTPANRDAMQAADPRAWTSPEAIARVVLFLLSSESAPTTGALVPVDAPA
jgi:NAD(P)-dependent dehydrogenase (short-subunit alcohol dehydrogenase family)